MRPFEKRRLAAPVLVLGAVATGAVLAEPAFGQYTERVVVATSSSSAGGHSSQHLSREVVERMAEELELDELQREVALDLYRDVSDTRQQLADAMRQSIEAARAEIEDGDFSKMFATIQALTSTYRDKTKVLEATYLEDLRAMLTGAQADAWPAAERVYRRGVHLGSLLRSEARVDLDQMMRREHPEAIERSEVADVLERWAIQVDTLLIERARKAEDIDPNQGFGVGVVALGDGEDKYKALRSIDARIVSASEQAMRSLQGVLEDDSIERTWLEAAFARVYRDTDGERRLAAAFELEDLGADQREQLEAAAAQHDREVAVARERWVKAEREREIESTLPPNVSVVVSGQEPTPSQLARDAVKELDARLETKLESILSAEQLAELPKPTTAEGAMTFTPGGGSGRAIRLGG